MLVIEDLHVDLPARSGRLQAVRGLSLAAAAGRTLAIVGESGSGKSITALSIMGLLPKGAQRRARRLTFDGIDLLAQTDRSMEDIRGNRIGMIFQDPTASFNPAYTIGEQLEEVHLRHCKKGRQDARKRAIDLLEQVGMPAPRERLAQYPFELSGGLRQRAMIAMALMCEPALVIADEPTTALDVTIQAQVLRVLRDLQRQMGLAVILITHDLGVVSAVADDVAVMYAGEIVEQSDVDALFASPQHPYTRGLLSCIPRIGSGQMGQRLPTIRGHVANLSRLPDGCVFAARCDMADDRCRKHPVELESVAPGHAVRCINAHLLEANTHA
ncbi:ABC transporter ATP-binding protein [Microvirga alba]|uniref:ABC transporter ATP-binding protein n=1 Tax=Microvirga alba TaxID=2791025 RepID=UPI001AED3020|nr:ABC transporter ATP-binding protein [Microvirga alba]